MALMSEIFVVSASVKLYNVCASMHFYHTVYLSLPLFIFLFFVILSSCPLLSSPVFSYLLLSSCLPVFTSPVFKSSFVLLSSPVFSCLPVFLSSCPPVLQSSCLPVFLSSCLLVFLSSCLPVFLYVGIYGRMGWDWMVIIGHRYSKSTTNGRRSE